MRVGMLMVMLALTGCDAPGTLAVAAADVEMAVLAPKPFEMTSEGRVFNPAQPLESLGLAWACVVLRTDYAPGPQSDLEHDYQVLMDGRTLSATFIDTRGVAHQVSGANLSWTMHGNVSSNGELSACLLATDDQVPEGTLIESIHLHSDRLLPVLGAYWETLPRQVFHH